MGNSSIFPYKGNISTGHEEYCMGLLSEALHIGSIMRLRDPNQSPSRKGRGVWAWATLSRKAATTWTRFQCEWQTKQGNDQWLSPNTPNTAAFHLILLLIPQAAKAILWTKPKSVQPGHLQVLASPGRTGSMLCIYAAVSSCFPSTCAPKRVKGDNSFIFSSVWDLKTVPSQSNTEAGKLIAH